MLRDKSRQPYDGRAVQRPEQQNQNRNRFTRNESPVIFQREGDVLQRIQLIMKTVFTILSVSLIVSGASVCRGALAVGFSGTYSQDFTGLASETGTGVSWENGTTLDGWSLFDKNDSAITSYNVGPGSSIIGSFYSFGSTDANDRALGGVGSGGTYFGSPASDAVAGYIAVALKNLSGSSYTEFTIQFRGEQWRNGGNTTAQSMVLQYGFGDTFTEVNSWTSPGGTFDYASPVHTGTAAAVDGNVAGLVSGLGGTIGSVSWSENQTLWVRWREYNDAGNDHGLAIDDFSVTAVPEPVNVALAVFGGISAGAWGVRRYRNLRRA